MPNLDSESYVDTVARAVGIELRPVERRGVALQLERIHAHARLVLDFELAPENEQNATPESWHAVEAAAHALGATRRIELPEVERARAAAFVITASEGGQLHLPNLRKRRGDFDPLTRDRLTAGALVPAAWYLHAQRLRRWFGARVREVFADVDVLLAPATPMSATPIGQETFSIRGRELPLRPNMGMLTQPLSFIGLPVAVAPLAGVGRLPLGVQIIAPAWREDLCLRVAAAMEAGGLACCGEPLKGALAA